MVKHQRLKITQLDDTLFSASSATEGGLRTLDYIPGATLLGAAAVRCYADCSDAWNLFHSGAVRFGDGLPLHCNGLPAWPAPLTWQRPKEGALVNGGNRLDVELVNASAGEIKRGLQRKPMRGANVTADGHTVVLKRRQSLKTAIDPDTGRIATGQLFQYESLAGDTQFVVTVSWDDGNDTLAEQAIKALCAGTFALGRSRSAEYGGATAEALDPAVVDWPRLPATDATQCISLWCLSDLCLLDANGQPCLSPTTAELGLPLGKLVAARSYIQTRAYSPFNAKRQAYDMERQVIARGSVLTFVFDQSQVVGTLSAILRAGVGLHREAGLGMVSVDHAWQLQSAFQVDCMEAFAESTKPVQVLPHSSTTPSLTAADTAFVDWLDARCAMATNDTARRLWARKKYEVMEKILASARQFPKHAAEPVEPSSTQWSTVGALAKEARSKSDLIRSLAGAGGPLHGAVTPDPPNETPEQKTIREKSRSGKNAEWFAAAFLVIDGQTGQESSQPIRLGDWLIAEIAKRDMGDDAGARVAALAALARAATKENIHGD